MVDGFSPEDVPAHVDLLLPTFRAIQELGGSGSIREVVNQVIEDMSLPSEVTQIPHSTDSPTDSRTRLEYNLAWARTYLKKYGLIDNSERGVWSLTPAGSKTNEFDPKEVARSVLQMTSTNRKLRADDELATEPTLPVDDAAEEAAKWRQDLLDTLWTMHPTAFERLCQRILRESGFIEVEVTGRSGDGGIDGHGIIRLAGLISFPVLFQSKRYRDSVGPDAVRDFRGAMVGRAEKGVIMTTGTFTRDAQHEATRDGAPPIDLIDGELLIDRLKELRLGVDVTTVEEVAVNIEFFNSI